MKNLIYFFLLFSTVVSSQNYNYAIDGPQKIAKPTGVNNQPDEVAYFKAYLLPLSQKANLQTALDTYGAVRLEKGDYSGVKVVMHSNQSLYGHPATNNITSITIAAGSTNVHIESLKPAIDNSLYINFQAGAAITNCTFKTLKYVEITATNASIENNTFVDIQGKVSFDCSISGYCRNNRIIKQQAQGVGEILIMKGNRGTPSYGNVVIHSNYLGSVRQTTDLDNLESLTLIGTDSETYGGLTRELLHVSNTDKLKLFVINGGISYNSGFGYSNLDAANIYAVANDGGADYLSKVSATSNLLSYTSNKNIIRDTGTVTGYFAKSYLEQVDRDYVQHFFYDGVDYSSTITNTTVTSKLTKNILGNQYKPWTRPTWETIPDPLGTNWKSERIGKPDSTSYIQNLINTNGLADLPEGVFYISSTLNIKIGAGQGIIGKGTGKTVICGLTDDFPLISVTTGDFGNIDLANLTLQGGSDGLYISNHTMMMSFQSLKYISFRNQTNGIHIYDIFGLDNCFFEHLAFINCTRGIYEHPFPGAVDPNNIAGSTYMDKNVFYQSQFINCDTSMALTASRASNLNAWVDCNFDGGIQATDLQADVTIFANCDFKNFIGNYTMKASSLNLLSCNFYNNTNAKSTLYSIINNIEGCNFLDNVPLGSPIDGNPVQNFIANSTITGNAVVMPDLIAWRPTYSTYVNSRLLSNPTFSKLLVKGVSNVPTIILNSTPNPYPQLLVTQ